MDHDDAAFCSVPYLGIFQSGGVAIPKYYIHEGLGCAGWRSDLKLVDCAGNYAYRAGKKLGVLGYL